MKASTLLNWRTAAVLAGLPFMAAWLQSVPSAASAGDATPPPGLSETVAATNTDDFAPILSTNEMQPSPPTLPPGMNLYGGAQEVVKLAQAGVGDEVILAYITNANVRFGVTSDQIIYLNDLGVSGTVVTAMMQHDASANAWTPANPPPAPTPSLATLPDTNSAYPPLQPADGSGADNPPPDNAAYTDSAAPYPGDNPGPDDTGYFYNSLQPYGTWIYLPGYGMCWQPTVCLRDHTWRPYCDRGRWLYSDCGWYWQSDYSWGWAAFHYGRWFCDQQRGWMWRPNRVWGPSWVAWRQGQSYCGWAPLPPSAVFTPGTGFQFHNQTVGPNFGFGLPAGLFAFIPIERFGDYAPSRYVAAPWEAGRIFTESRVLSSVSIQNQHVANLGMDPRLVDARAGVRMRRATIQEVPGTDANGRVQPDRLGRHQGSLVIYRPQLPSAPIRQGNGPSAGGPAGAMPRTAFAVPSTAPVRTPGISGTAGFAAAQPGAGAGADASSRVHVYNVTHQNPNPASSVSWFTPEAGKSPATRPTASETYAPNSMVLVGRRNPLNPQWTPNGETPSGGQSYIYRPGSVATYAVTPGTAVQGTQAEPQNTRSSHVIGGGATTGNQPYYGNPYYRSQPAVGSAPDPRPYSGAGYESRPAGYAPPAQTYNAAPQPRGNYSAQPRENYSAPQPRENYSAPSSSSSSRSSSSSPSSLSSSSSSSSSGSSQRR